MLLLCVIASVSYVALLFVVVRCCLLLTVGVVLLLVVRCSCGVAGFVVCNVLGGQCLLWFVVR